MVTVCTLARKRFHIQLAHRTPNATRAYPEQKADRAYPKQKADRTYPGANAARAYSKANAAHAFPGANAERAYSKANAARVYPGANAARPVHPGQRLECQKEVVFVKVRLKHIVVPEHEDNMFLSYTVRVHKLNFLNYITEIVDLKK